MKNSAVLEERLARKTKTIGAIIGTKRGYEYMKTRLESSDQFVEKCHSRLGERDIT